jgi:uncharacterized membrane protein required for colicin V production
MNWFDAIVVVVVLASILVGWRTGILKTAFTVAGMLLGYMLGTSDAIQGIFLDLVGDRNLAFFLSFLVPFTLTMVMARILWIVVRKTLQFVMLGWVDGAIGAAKHDKLQRLSHYYPQDPCHHHSKCKRY